MKLTLQGCAHKRITRTGNMFDQDKATYTCLTCYERLRFVNDPTSMSGMSVTVDTAPPPCRHLDRLVPVQTGITKDRDYRDALCEDCGRVLRHPDGKGTWDEVLFYGYIIREMP